MYAVAGLSPAEAVMDILPVFAVRIYTPAAACSAAQKGTIQLPAKADQ